MTLHLTFDLPEGLLPADLSRDSESAAHELLLAALVKWYERGMISSGWAAEAAGITRADFLETLARYEVSPFQYTPEEMEADVAPAKDLRA